MAKKKKKKIKNNEDNNYMFMLQRDGENRIVCVKEEYKGNLYLNIRYQYLDVDNEEWKWTNKGISIPFKNDLANKFMKKARVAFKKEK